MELAGEVGFESMRRLEAASGANEGLNLPICKKVRIGMISSECGKEVEKARRRKLCVWVEDRLLPVCYNCKFE